MNHVIGISICFAGTVALARFEDVDPVVRAKAQRTLNDSHDLPPIPRGLTEPPPLPPPELHTHDIRRQRRSGAVAGKGARAPKKQAAQSKAQAAKGGARVAPKAPGGPKPKASNVAAPRTAKAPPAANAMAKK